MKLLIILLSLLSVSTLASDKFVPLIPTVTKSIQQLQQNTDGKAALSNQIVKLQLELRETKRKYYAAKTENIKLKNTIPEQSLDKFTTADVERIVESSQNEMYLSTLSYTVAERNFLMSLDSKEDVMWMLQKLQENSMESFIDLNGSMGEVKLIEHTYENFYESNRNAATDDGY